MVVQHSIRRWFQMISTCFNHLADANWLTASWQVACSIWLLVQAAVRFSFLRAIIGHLSLMLPELDRTLLASCSRQGPFYHSWIQKSCSLSAPGKSTISDDGSAKAWICSTKRTTSSCNRKKLCQSCQNLTPSDVAVQSVQSYNQRRWQKWVLWDKNETGLYGQSRGCKYVSFESFKEIRPSTVAPLLCASLRIYLQWNSSFWFARFKSSRVALL